MEIIISICAVGISLLTLVLNRRDKVVEETKENNLAVINYQLKELKEDIGKLSSKLDKYDDEMDERIDKAIKLHERLYHKKEV